MTRTIATASGHHILVDDEDYDALSSFKWHITPNGYAARSIRVDGKQVVVRMHRVILGLARDDPRLADHINGARLDNRRANLRICTKTENNRNARRPRTNRAGFKGTSLHRDKRKWQARIQCRGRTKHLGYFDTPELAHEFYCLAADLLFGEFANHG